MFFLVLLGLFLRLSFINKPEGLWNDEYVSWFVANTPFNEGFWSEVLKQCHMPFYYLYLKPFSHCSDLVLRLTSLIPGILAIPVMYLVGREFSKRGGYYAAAITSTLSFLIYYSQEVRFYSLLFLFSALSLLFTIRYIKKSSKKNLAGYIISNSLILLTHVLGGIYVFFNLLVVFYKKKKISKAVVIIFLCLLPLVGLLGVNILRMLPSSQWWGHFSYTNILFLFSDFLSPILTNNINAPTVFFYNKQLILWMLVPTLLGLIGFLAGFKKTLSLNILAFLVIFVMSILAISGKLVFITKYAIEILPILILTIVLGFEQLKKTGVILFALFVSFHLAAFFTPHYVTKVLRAEGHRIPAQILNSFNPDSIVFTYYEPQRFVRYIDLNGKNVYHISKSNRFDNPVAILGNIKPNSTVAVVFLDSVSFFDEEFVAKNKGNPNIPEMFLTFSRIKNSLIRTLNHDYKDFRLAKIGEWTVICARKK